MRNKQQLKESLKQMLSQKRGKAFYSERLGVDINTVQELLDDIRGEENYHSQERAEEFINKIGYTENSLNVEGYYDHPPQPEEVISDHKIDTKKWKLSSYWSKQKSAGKWYVSAQFTPTKPEDNIAETVEKILKNYKANYKPRIKKSLQRSKFPCSLLLSLPDLHLDKLTLDNVSADERGVIYLEAIDKLVDRATSSHDIEEIVFVIGNDYLHTDSFNITTTKGTQLTSNTSWEEAYEKAFNVLISGIDSLRNKCNNLKVILVQGNHSRTKEYYLAHAVETFFRSDKNIQFQRDSSNLKIHKYGETLLCFSHGDNVNDKLPLVFATSFYKEWGECKYKEIILADKHHNSEKMIRSQGEAGGVRMRILPSLGGTDIWHQDNLYVGAIQAGIALVYDKKLGKISEFEHRI